MKGNYVAATLRSDLWQGKQRHFYALDLELSINFIFSILIAYFFYKKQSASDTTDIGLNWF